MQEITELNNDSRQKITLVTDTGIEIPFLLEFKPNQEGWFFDLEYNDTVLNGVRLCTFPNVLRQFKNIFPFGIACLTTDGGEPYYIDDFSSGRASIFLLNEEEVEFIEENVFGVS